MEFRDIWGRAAKAISREMGVFPQRGEAHLIEVRQEPNAMSYTAHSERKFVELAIFRDGRLVLVETDCEALKQTRTTVPPAHQNHPVEQFSQAWCPQKGPIDDARLIKLGDEFAARQRIEKLAWKVRAAALKNKRPQLKRATAAVFKIS